MALTGCSPQTVTPGVVVFNAAEFQSQYPAFATVSSAALQNNFNLATLMLNNTCCSVVEDAPTRQQLLYLLVAHLTALLNGANGQPASGVVGRVSDATEGSVSVSADLGAAPTTSQYIASLQQTQYGLQFLAMMTKYRTARQFVSAFAIANQNVGTPYGWPGGGITGWPL